MGSPPPYDNEDRPSILQVSPNTNSIFVTPPAYRSQQFTHDHTNTSCNVSLNFHFNSPQGHTNDNPIASRVDISTSLDPDIAGSTIYQSEFVQRTSAEITRSSAEITRSSANMCYGTARTPNRLNFQFNSPLYQNTVNPTACNVNVSTSLDDDVLGSSFFDSEFIQCTPADMRKSSADIRESSADIRESSANVATGTAKTPNNHFKRKSSSPGQNQTSPDHHSSSSTYR
ncbi:hypothetical protein ZOSMA_45G00440 [Zostera marina]|uniref:Uncharacterized protein n=1 Tax=Zostera marina TaxID=29655 RepID=A0A0K9P0J5_ZOSMR|nr:hypothetical protein ZOSMA_45G00440 [Zostera marina]